MNGGIVIARIKGVPVRLHPSLIVVAALLVLLSIGEAHDGSDALRRLLAPLILLLTVILHEVGHTLAAMFFGIRVVDIVLTPFGGMARLEGAVEDGRKEALISLAGPAANLTVALLAWIVATSTGERMPGLREIFLLEVPADVFYADRPLLALFGFNLLLGVLNLLPAFPMDGGRILRGAWSVRHGRLAATRLAFKTSTWIALGLILLPFFLDGAHWWIAPFIGVFVFIAALKERVMVAAREGLRSSGIDFRVFTSHGPRGDGREGGAIGGKDGSDGVIDVDGSSRRLGRGGDESEDDPGRHDRDERR